MKPYLAAFVAFAFTGPALAAALLHDATVINSIYHGRQTSIRIDPDGVANPVALDSGVVLVAAPGGRRQCRLHHAGRMADKAVAATPVTA
jgi:hypothetical protein